MPEGAPGPLELEGEEGLAQQATAATVTLLAGGALDDYLKTGENLSGVAGAVAKMAPLPDADDIHYAEVLLEKLYARRHSAGLSPTGAGQRVAETLDSR